MNSTQNTKSRTITTNFMMTALLAVFFIAASSGQAEAQTTATSVDSHGWVQSFEQAFAESESSGKPMMFVFSGSDWCSYCQRLEQEVLQTPEFESWSSANVIKVMVDFPKYHALPAEIARQNQNLKEHFAGELKGYPTVLLVQSNGSVIGRTGYVAGGPMPWISKADLILQQSQHRLADTSYQSR